MSETAPTAHPDLMLADGFDAHNAAAWRAAIDKILGRADFTQRLVSRTADGIALEPLYMQAKGRPPVIAARPGQPWRITQRVDHPVAADANRFALDDLENGAAALALVPADGFAARGFGLPALTAADLDQILADVALDMIEIRLEPSFEGPAHAAALASLVEQRGIGAANTDIAFALAPLAQFMAAGQLPEPWPAIADGLARTVIDLGQRGFKGPLIACDARPVSEAGGSEAQELGLLIAQAVLYMRELEARAVPVAAAAAMISFTVPVDAAQFEGTAKLRALRKLWARILAVSNIPEAPVRIHAETAWRMATKRDPAVNMLRATMATFASGIGGADSMTILPHTAALGLPDAFARRIARNTQSVLLEESNLWRVADPSAGAGGIEALTDALCNAAWSLFQEIEREGGLISSLEAGGLQDRIAAIAADRAGRLATRRDAITGTSEFPQFDDATSGLLDIRPMERASNTGGAVVIQPLPSHRLAEPWEALRDRADAYKTATGARPRVFLANLGPIAEHNARALWITNLLAAGGIAAISGDGFTTSADAGAAFAASGATIACICSNDSNYALLGEATASALKSAGATRVLLAGRQTGELAAAGVDTFLHVGIDVLAALRRLHTDLGIDHA